VLGGGSNVLLVEWAFHLAEANSCGARSGIIRAELMLLGGRWQALLFLSNIHIAEERARWAAFFGKLGCSRCPKKFQILVALKTSFVILCAPFRRSARCNLFATRFRQKPRLIEK
jgi:hypothetical protein